MQVQHGWSGEVSGNQWAKFRVTVDEEDLRRLLAAAGVTEPDDARRGLSTAEAYQLLELEAERLVLVKLIQRYGFDPAEGKAAIGRLETQKRAALTKIRARVYLSRSATPDPA